MYTLSDPYDIDLAVGDRGLIFLPLDEAKSFGLRWGKYNPRDILLPDSIATDYPIAGSGLL